MITATRPLSFDRWLAPRRQRVLLLLAVATYFISILAFRQGGGLSLWRVSGDQLQSVGHLWRYRVDGAMPPGQLISDYAFAYHSPPLWLLITGTLAHWDPWITAKLLGPLAYLALAVVSYVLVAHRTNRLYGVLVAALVMRSPDLALQVTPGMARSFGPALLLLFLYALVSRRHWLALVTLLLQVGIYPSVVIPCGITYSGYCLFKGPMRDRVRRCASMLVVGLAVLALGQAQNLRSPEWWGPVVKYEEAATMRAWLRPKGRFEEVPHRAAHDIIHGNIVRAYKPAGHAIAGTAGAQFFADYAGTCIVGVPFVLALVGLAVRRRRMNGDTQTETHTETQTDSQTRTSAGVFPWEWVWLFAGAIAGYALARSVAFTLFLPSRQLGFSLQYIVVTGLPVLLWHAAMKVMPHRRRHAFGIAAGLGIAMPFLLLGDGLGAVKGGGHASYAQDAQLFEHVRALPVGDEVACDVQRCDAMMLFGRHAPYAARNLAHPLRRKYYEEVERRIVAMQRVLYATSRNEVARFYEKEKVRWFVYDTASTTAVLDVYEPLRKKLRDMQKASAKKKQAFILNDPPPESVVFRDGTRMIIDLSMIKRR